MKTATEKRLEKQIEQMKKDFAKAEKLLSKGMTLSKAELYESMGKLEQHRADVKKFKELISKLRDDLYGVGLSSDKDESRGAWNEIEERFNKFKKSLREI